MKYTAYSTMDFVMDEHFQKWVLNPDEATTSFWQQWCTANPGKKDDVEAAKQLLLMNRFKRHNLTASQFEEIRHGIEYKLANRPLTVVSEQKSGFNRMLLLKVAASITVLLIALSVFLLKDFNVVKHATVYGQMEEILLPDGSSVFLNANSSISYEDNWKEPDALREVWLEGEAFFEVSKRQKVGNPDTPEAEKLVKFIVHARELDIEVVGTQFNVINRHKSVEVVLNEGKVRLVLEDGDQKIIMDPGELITYSSQNQDITRETVNPEIHSSWRNHKLILDGQTLLEFARILEDNYGVEAIFENETLPRKKITGTLPSDNLEVILTALRQIYRIDILIEGNRVIFKE